MRSHVTSALWTLKCIFFSFDFGGQEQKSRDVIKQKRTFKNRKGRSKTGRGRSKAGKDVLKQEIIGKN